MANKSKYTAKEERQILRDCLVGLFQIVKHKGTDHKLYDSYISRLQEVGTTKYALKVGEKYLEEVQKPDWLN